MLDLQVRAGLDGTSDAPFVVKLLGSDELRAATLNTEDLAVVEALSADRCTARTARGTLILDAPAAQLAGNVLFVEPRLGRAQRWFRRGDTQNTLLITERCDQLCIMCSQPPKKTHTDYFEHFERACLLADEGADIGLSGGEPTLFKGKLFQLVERVRDRRQDVTFHILTNAQHFVESDLPQLCDLRGDIVWGVPVYASDPSCHDEVVGKLGAFKRLEASLALLSRANAMVEIRTVITQQTAPGLVDLAYWLSSHLPGAWIWALMQLERQGFASGRWMQQFFDHSISFDAVGDAVAVARARGLDALLYNVPRCTVPEAFRSLCPSTISDWKRAFPSACQACREKELCSGLFAWHDMAHPYAAWGAL